MKNYREIYCNAIYRLGKAYGTPDYTAAKEKYYNVFRDLAISSLREGKRPVEIVLDDFIEMYGMNTAERNEWGWFMDDLAEEIKILHQVNYPWVAEWEEEYQFLKGWLADPDELVGQKEWLKALTA